MQQAELGAKFGDDIPDEKAHEEGGRRAEAKLAEGNDAEHSSERDDEEDCHERRGAQQICHNKPFIDEC